MDYSGLILKNEEKAVFNLRELYKKYGYAQYKMSKFEEYDLYVRNKSFLVSDRVITFTDTDGKLMALKPDVTLSIVKNTQDGDCDLRKLYYDEHVYRVSESSHSFKEIMQTGLECIGEIDMYALSEVIMLAAKSLATISDNYVLDISHMGVIAAFLDGAGIEGADRDEVLRCIGEKNTHELREICKNAGVKEENAEKLAALASLYGPVAETVDQLKALRIDDKADDAIWCLQSVCDIMKEYGLADHMCLDFSIVNDMNYYSGIVFCGSIDGIPASVLSGGQYDNLLHKIGKDAGAVGFAVYLDLLERFNTSPDPYDVDVLLVYDDEADAKDVIRCVKQLTDAGKTVRAQKRGETKIRCRQVMTLGEGGLEILETNG